MQRVAKTRRRHKNNKSFLNKKKANFSFEKMKYNEKYLQTSFTGVKYIAFTQSHQPEENQPQLRDITSVRRKRLGQVVLSWVIAKPELTFNPLF